MNAAAPPVWRMRAIGACGVGIAAFETGSSDADAPAVLLLHGLGHWTVAAWERLVPQLDPAARYVGFDLPGFGDSEKPAARYDLPYFRRTIEEAAAALGLDRFALVGHSLGGFLAADFAGAHPERVDRLALIAPAGFARSPRHLAYGLAGGFARWLFTRAPSRRFVTRTLERSVVDPSVLDPALLARAHALAEDRAVRETFAGVYEAAMRVFLDVAAVHREFARYRGPVFCAWGRHDRYLAVEGLDAVRRVYPEALTMVLERSAHLPMIEEPVRLGAALRAYLRGFIDRRRAAAVVLAISADPPHGVVFVERASHLREHAGQIGFPGGGVEPADGDDRAMTALRELHEELGVPRERVTLVGALPEALLRTGLFDITPYVGVLACGTKLVIDPAEAAAVFSVPLAEIVAPGALRDGVRVVNGVEIPSVIFEHGERVVWGISARILRSFVAAWNDDRDGLRMRIQAALHAPGLDS